MGNSESLSPPQSNSKFYKYQTGKDHIIIHINIESKTNQLTPWLATKQHTRHIYSHPNILKTDLHRTINNGICNDSCLILMKSDKFTDNLYDEINKRKTISRYYRHEQIWYLLLNVVKLAVNVHANGWKWIVGNIHPKNILINQEGQIRIIATYSLPFEEDHFTTFKKQGLLSAFISPELIGFTYSKDKAYDNFPQCVNKQISQNFTIGMTILSMCILETNLSQIYDLSFYYNTNSNQIKHGEQSRQTNKNYVKSNHNFNDLINKKILNSFINKIKERYCSLLGTIIMVLMNPNPNQRLSILSLYDQIIRPNQNSILQMKLDWIREGIKFLHIQDSYKNEEEVKQA